MQLFALALTTALASPPDDPPSAVSPVLGAPTVRAILWDDDAAGWTLGSLVPTPPKDGQIVLITVVDGVIGTPEVEPPVATRDPEPSEAKRPTYPAAKNGWAMSISVPPDVRVTKFEVSCPSGFRQRASFARGVATLRSMPEEDCTVTFKGGSVVTKFMASPGDYACRTMNETGSQLACSRR